MEDRGDASRIMRSVRTEAKDVGGRCLRVRVKELPGHVDVVTLVPVFHIAVLAHHTEVTNLQCSVFCQEYVLRLDVHVDETVRVNVLQPCGNVNDKAPDRALGHRHVTQVLTGKCEARIV